MKVSFCERHYNRSDKTAPHNINPVTPSPPQCEDFPYLLMWVRAFQEFITETYGLALIHSTLEAKAAPDGGLNVQLQLTFRDKKSLRSLRAHSHDLENSLTIDYTDENGSIKEHKTINDIGLEITLCRLHDTQDKKDANFSPIECFKQLLKDRWEGLPLRYPGHSIMCIFPGFDVNLSALKDKNNRISRNCESWAEQDF